MAKPISVLFVSSEVFPFAKHGGIADVSFSLSLALRDLGHDIRVMLPKYGHISERKNKIHEINRLKEIQVPIADGFDTATVKSSSINNLRTKVQSYITTNVNFLDANKGIYQDLNTGIEFPNNDERFLFFSRTVVESCLLLGWFPDIIHCNDWQTSVIPAYIKSMFPNKFKKTKTVLTIHNFYNQGVFPAATFAKTGLSKDVRASFIHKKSMNFLKGGIAFSDYITTVSPEYAQEILQEKELSNGLNAFLAESKHKFTGILNGVDPWTWNPEYDSYLTKKYNNNLIDFKEQNKKQLLKYYCLPYEEEVPVISMIARLDSQKGIDLFLETASDILKNNIKLVILGIGDTEITKKLKAIAKRYPNKMGVVFGYNEELSHVIEAGSDMLIIPSRYEPCGLNAMYSMLYGTVPIVHYTGGLKNIVCDFNTADNTGNGIVFTTYDNKSFLDAIKKALNLFKNKEIWKLIVQNGMKSDFSWKTSVEKYDEIYRKLLKD